ncbi:RHG25 protein, partial [Emberiza fucata]|nr:RHG25 protein [Emberiza fucata]
ARSRSVMTADPAALPRPDKLGWLRKQRSIVKNWQLRFFVLRGQQLLYYKDEDEAKPQYFCPAGVAGEQPRAVQEPCVLMASSQAELEEWVKSLRRALGSASGDLSKPRVCKPQGHTLSCAPVSPGVFGQCLAQTVAQEQRFGQHLVPLVVQKSAEFILEHGVAEEGIFRLPGQDSLVRQLREAFDAGERPSFSRSSTSTPRVTPSATTCVWSCPRAGDTGRPHTGMAGVSRSSSWALGTLLELFFTIQGHQELLKQLSLLPRDNYNLLSYICRFLYEIQLNSSINKMSVDNLATVMGVNLIRPRVEDPAVIMRGTPQVQRVMTVMISDHQKLFPPSKDEPPSPPAPKHEKKAPVPRSSVGWGAAEEPRGSTPRQTRDHPNFSSSPGPAATSSVPGEDSEPTATLGTWKTQPRKRTQTLPSRKSFLAAPGDKGRSDVLASDFWKSSPRPLACEGHKRTLSHDLFKLLDLHRAASCDSNVAESGEGSGSSPSPASSTSEKEFLPCFSPCHEPKEPGSPSSSPAEESRADQDSREFLQGVIHKLEKDLEEQRSDYEGQVESLQKENYEVWAKVVRLNQELEQERKRSGELELRLKNAERSWEELERKTRMLEEEIKNLTK